MNSPRFLLSVSTAGRTSAILSAALLALSLAGNAGAQPNEIRYQDRISGAAAPSAFDVNGDGVTGHYVTYAGWSTLGIVNGAMLVEYDFASGPQPDAACPAGQVRFPILASAGNRALTVRGLGTPGGQVFLRDDHESAVFCLDPVTSAFTMSLKGAFVGGLGMLKDASGEYSYKGYGQVLLQDANGMPFGPFTIETKGVIVLPRGSRLQ